MYLNLEWVSFVIVTFLLGMYTFLLLVFIIYLYFIQESSGVWGMIKTSLWWMVDKIVIMPLKRCFVKLCEELDSRRQLGKMSFWSLLYILGKFVFKLMKTPFGRTKMMLSCGWLVLAFPCLEGLSCLGGSGSDSLPVDQGILDSLNPNDSEVVTTQPKKKVRFDLPDSPSSSTPLKEVIISKETTV